MPDPINNPAEPPQASQPSPAGETGNSPTDQADPLVLDARSLFHGQREILIEHDGIRYRLRITRRNKLILQK
jgi:hemin uptake protein HemP